MDRRLWKQYVQEQRKTEVVPQEKYLFHGSMAIDPHEIFASSEGFSMRFSSQGKWGQAVYFAQNASHYQQLSFATKSGEK